MPSLYARFTPSVYGENPPVDDQLARHLHNQMEGPEPETGAWWEGFRLSHGILLATGNWPARDHPEAGWWVRSVKSHLQDKKYNLDSIPEGPMALTRPRYRALQKAGYLKYLEEHKHTHAKPSNGFTARIRTALAAGVVPHQHDVTHFWNEYNDGRGRESDAANLRKAGCTNPKET